MQGKLDFPWAYNKDRNSGIRVGGGEEMGWVALFWFGELNCREHWPTNLQFMLDDD